jgi:hypothetical protein
MGGFGRVKAWLLSILAKSSLIVVYMKEKDFDVLLFKTWWISIE